MHLAYQISLLLSIAAFLFYGVSCLFADGMVVEFERYGLSRFRRFTGGLEVAGALGLIAGYLILPIGIAAAGGLALLMLCGVAARMRVGDRLVSMLPAIVLLLMNLYVFLYAIRFVRPA